MKTPKELRDVAEVQLDLANLVDDLRAIRRRLGEFRGSLGSGIWMPPSL